MKGVVHHATHIIMKALGAIVIVDSELTRAELVKVSMSFSKAFLEFTVKNKHTCKLSTKSPVHACRRLNCDVMLHVAVCRYRIFSNRSWLQIDAGPV